MVFSIIVSYPERSYIEYTRMLSLTNQYVINLVVSFPIRRSSRLFVKVSVWEHRALNNLFFSVTKFTILTPSSLLSWCRLSFPIIGLKISSLPNFTLQSPNRILIWYLGKSSKTALIRHKNCLLNHQFSPHLVHAHSKQWYYSRTSQNYIGRPITNKIYSLNC